MDLIWDKPKPIVVYNLPEYPIDVFPKWIKDTVIMLSRSLHVREDMIANSILGALSASLLGKYYFHYNATNWRLGLNLFVISALYPGAKKDAVQKIIFKVLLDEQERLLKKDHENSSEKLSLIHVKKHKYERLIKRKGAENDGEASRTLKEIQALQAELDQKYFIISGDVTNERMIELVKNNGESLTVATAEATELIDHMLGRYSSEGSIDFILKAWEGAPYTKNRSTREDLMLKHPLINLNLLTQPSELAKFHKMAHRGLLQRFLVVLPEKYPLNKISLSQKVDKNVIDTFHNNIRCLYETNNVNKEITVSEEAEHEFNELKMNILKKQYGDVDQLTEEWLAKVFSNLIKVTTLIKLSDTLINNKADSITLNKVDINKMEILFNYYYTHFQHINGKLNNSKDVLESKLPFFFRRLLEVDAKKGKKGVITLTDITNYIKKFNGLERNQMLQRLEEHNLIQINLIGKKREIHFNPEIKKMPLNKALDLVKDTNR
ncbi:DUF3987 domain-containing protein [Aquisalibacillus elongatus]|uniref:Uncharacterized protein DUF3987 n=1 Tax=Aquisalibacillus elongatus TaxID=485577 RepID=A0A3N5BGX3_9BACI|nr:DUF3987 domain-containing protein [Aquisalibacillus elongatus]RPF57034.1 uncharacterized protein DUF3987 [Aquisalibacillus elongatus]